jgi:hypothetical protein
MRGVFSTVLLVGLAGCATTNSQEEINYYAGMWYYSRMCYEAGLLDRDTAAKGMAFASSRVYRSETPRLQAKLQEYAAAREIVNQQSCSDVGLRIAQATITIAPSQAQAAPRQPITTNCNTAFGQTFCTTY